MHFKFAFVVFAAAAMTNSNKTWLRADGDSNNTYNLLNSVFGGTGGIAYEVPDCGHPVPHITQRFDPSLNRYVFAFHIHVAHDNDRCINFDRQRVEIKTSTLSNLKGYEGDTVTLSWNFRLNSQIQVSRGFTSIHQIKAKGGDDEIPLISFNARRKGSSKIFEIIYVGRDGQREFLAQDDLSKFAGKWVHAVEELTYSKNGKYSLVLTRTDNGEPLLTVTNDTIDLWRDSTEYMRPKWGIYRSLAEASELRDEDVYFDNFCLSNGIEKCT